VKRTSDIVLVGFQCAALQPFESHVRWQRLRDGLGLFAFLDLAMRPSRDVLDRVERRQRVGRDSHVELGFALE
jgi:hypothetical protein